MKLHTCPAGICLRQAVSGVLAAAGSPTAAPSRLAVDHENMVRRKYTSPEQGRVLLAAVEDIARQAKLHSPDEGPSLDLSTCLHLQGLLGTQLHRIP